MTLNSLRAILFFDLDNTLVEIKNSHAFFDSIIVDVFNEFKIIPPTKEKRDLLWRNSDFRELLKSWNFPYPKKFWKSFDKMDLIRRKELHSQGNLRIFDDVIPVFQKLHSIPDIRMILITNSSSAITKFELETFKLENFFLETLALGDTQDLCKPNPTRINETLELLSKEYIFSRDGVYIIGDSPFDISAGKNANIKSILLRRTDRSKRKFKDEPDYRLKSMDQLLAILNL